MVHIAGSIHHRPGTHAGTGGAAPLPGNHGTPTRKCPAASSPGSRAGAVGVCRGKPASAVRQLTPRPRPGIHARADHRKPTKGAQRQYVAGTDESNVARGSSLPRRMGESQRGGTPRDGRHGHRHVAHLFGAQAPSHFAGTKADTPPYVPALDTESLAIALRAMAGCGTPALRRAFRGNRSQDGACSLLGECPPGRRSDRVLRTDSGVASSIPMARWAIARHGDTGATVGARRSSGGRTGVLPSQRTASPETSAPALFPWRETIPLDGTERSWMGRSGGEAYFPKT